MADWKAIDSAPRDGESILLCNPQGVPRVGFWNGNSWDDGDITPDMGEYLFWQELPEPPAGEPLPFGRFFPSGHPYAAS